MKKEIFYKAEKMIYVLSTEQIETLEKTTNDVAIFNVISGIENECYVILNYKDTICHYIYLSNFEKLKGFGIEIDIKDKDRNYYLNIFSSFLSQQIENLDAITCFNSFQHFSKGVFEKDGYYVIDELPKNKGSFVLAIKSKKGLLRVPTVNRKNYYMNIFASNRKEYSNNNKINKIYLMLNSRNNFIKIGRSKEILIREKTLQSEEPEIMILSAWIAGKDIENLLHSKFKRKRIRGEWFNLTINDLIEIKEIMSIFKKVKLK